MKKLLFLILFCSTLAQAQEKAIAGIGFDLAMPMGTFSHNYKWGYGASFKIQIPLRADKVYVPIQIGLLNFKSKITDSDLNSSYNSTYIKAGIGYRFTDFLYSDASIGAVFISRGLGTGLILSPNIGTQFQITERLKGDISLRYEEWLWRNRLSYASIRLGINF